jgi:hypothetical protein
MPFNVLLLPLLGGFIFVRYWNRTKYHAIRADNQRILLLAATAGVIALGLAFSIKVLLGLAFPCVDYPRFPCVPVVWYRFIPFPYSAASVLAFLLGALLWMPLNKGVITWVEDIFKTSSWSPLILAAKKASRSGWDTPEEIDRVIYEDGDPMDVLLRRAEKAPKTILVTLKSGKVYIGFVTSTNPPSAPTRSIGIVPTKSGHRHPETKEVTYDVYYSDALSRIDSDIELGLAELKDTGRRRKRLVSRLAADRRKVPRVVSLEDEIKRTTEINHLKDHEADLTEYIENLAGIIEDFRLVFPVDEVSTISIYREEVNEEYFMAPERSAPPESPEIPMPV